MGLFSRDIIGEKARRIAESNARVMGTTVRVTRPAPVDAPEQQEAQVFDRCPSCHGVLYAEDLEQNGRVCPNCGYHFRLSARERIAITADVFEEFNGDLVAGNPLNFPGYEEKLAEMRQKTGEKEGVVTGVAEIRAERCVLAVMDGAFIMGSMGAAVGEKFARAVEKAIELRLPLVAFTVSGGARMQEGLVSLMQMAKTSAALAKLDEAGLLYIAVITDPTTGGVTASFAMLGDITLAEPQALIGFAGRRVIQQTLNQTLPADFQSAEFQMKRGFVDRIVKRKRLPETIARLIRLHAPYDGGMA